MTNSQLNSMAEDIRTESYNKSSAGTDLIFDPSIGEFRTVPRGYSPSSGETVTNFSTEGFAAMESNPVIYLNENDIITFLESRDDYKVGSGSKWPGEDVIHLTSGISNKVVGLEQVRYCFFSGKDNMYKDTVKFGTIDFAVFCDQSSVEVYKVKKDVESEGSSGKFLLDGPLPFEYIPAQGNLYSRARGLLEVGILESKRVAIIGLGSFGSQIAIELAKAGVGSFSLMDFDRVELHNLMRHTATVHDLGRLKTDIISDAILGKNPYAHIDKLPININEHPDILNEEVEKADLVICATDNNTSRYLLTQALVEKRRVGIFGRAITRAEGGDVFRYRPGGPCYCCMVGSGNLQQEEITDVASARRDGRIAAYVSPEDAAAMVQVGLSSDIEPICNLMVKIALVELSRGAESGITSLEDELSYDCYIWANRRDSHYSNWKSFSAPGPMPSILRWYGVRVNKNEHCPVCSNNIILDDSTDDIEVMPENPKR